MMAVALPSTSIEHLFTTEVRELLELSSTKEWKMVLSKLKKSEDFQNSSNGSPCVKVIEILLANDGLDLKNPVPKTEARNDLRPILKVSMRMDKIDFERSTRSIDNEISQFDVGDSDKDETEEMGEVSDNSEDESRSDNADSQSIETVEDQRNGWLLLQEGLPGLEMAIGDLEETLKAIEEGNQIASLGWKRKVELWKNGVFVEWKGMVQVWKKMNKTGDQTERDECRSLVAAVEKNLAEIQKITSLTNKWTDKIQRLKLVSDEWKAAVGDLVEKSQS